MALFTYKVDSIIIKQIEHFHNKRTQFKQKKIKQILNWYLVVNYVLNHS